MRIVQILTALIVTGVLYLVVFEREQLLAFAGAAPQTEQQANAPEDTGHVVSVVAQAMQAQEIDSAVILRGQTEAARKVELRSEITGQVISSPLRKGKYVTRDTIMCELDPGTRQANLAEANAAIAEAEAARPEASARVIEAQAVMREAEINARAARELSKNGYASETKLANAEAAIESARAAVEAATGGLASAEARILSAQAAVASAEKEIDRLTIEAPFDGIIEDDTAELGSLMQPGSLCGTVIQLDPIKVVGFVPETEVNRIEMGAKAGARLTTGQQVVGRVTFLSRSADEVTRTFRVEIDVANPDLDIREGQTAEVAISAPGAKAHLLPQSSLTLNDDGALGVRVVDTGDIVRFIPVKVLRDTVDGIWVSGLPETVSVIVVGQEYVVDGVTVKPTYREAQQ
ncbi:efflux RND transporter periplasmic adaptor subunit [Donghicola sp. C2-DW-16]|uniref:Efflux RND transporter periplasmic adaptor subunit n=1 Tax=Donghicola mangrovi TaxID=2729614 RepID=A0ABX2PE05_9RHOB|nr:efflux RND transporter periplasmic adaptor subunit [Donghicola mangrovi]NVO27716.1 efflux RND transporter periplasmic adaptor subunit [Donghicola mangrovi]